MEIKKKDKPVLLLIFTLMLSLPSFAVMDLTFNEPLPINRIQYYWNGDTVSANNGGRIINPDKDANIFVADPNLQAKPKETPPTKIYIFGSDVAFPNSETTIIRLWSGTQQIDNMLYTDKKSYINPAGTGKSYLFLEPYLFIKAQPPAASIYQSDEILSKTIPGGVETRKLEVSASVPKLNGYTVEIKSMKWDVKYTPFGGVVQNVDVAAQTGAKLTLQTPGNIFNPGDQYRMTVKPINLWGQAADLSSNIYLYTVGAQGAVAEQTFVLHLKSGVDQNKPGINSFAMPFAGSWYAFKYSGDPLNPKGAAINFGLNNTNEIKMAGDLVKIINRAANMNVVSSFAKWRNVADKQDVFGVMISYNEKGPGGVMTETKVPLADGPTLDHFALEQGEGYQVYIGKWKPAPAEPNPPAAIDLVITNTL